MMARVPPSSRSLLACLLSAVHGNAVITSALSPSANDVDSMTIDVNGRLPCTLGFLQADAYHQWVWYLTCASKTFFRETSIVLSVMSVIVCSLHTWCDGKGSNVSQALRNSAVLLLDPEQPIHVRGG